MKEATQSCLDVNHKWFTSIDLKSTPQNKINRKTTTFTS